jgi:hypothetical protein
VGVPTVRDALTAKVCDTLNSQESGTLRSEVIGEVIAEVSNEGERGSLTSSNTSRVIFAV